MSFQILWLLPLALQGLFISVDEFYFHQKRELPLWERLGHPLDTLSLCICIAIAAFTSPDPSHIMVFSILSLLSCVLITKDEWVHARYCKGAEHWIHSVLFILHPVALFSIAVLWVSQTQLVLLQALFALTLGYAAYQLVYWNIIQKKRIEINNTFYDELGEGWYQADHHPIAFLRASSDFFATWIDLELRKSLDPRSAKILEVGCGGGLLTNALAKRGWRVFGIDLSKSSLEVAKNYDSTGTVDYQVMDASHLRFENETFDAVLSMDMLEHVQEPCKVISESARVLQPEGLFLFHTFNRTLKSYILAVKALDWLYRGKPKHIHVYNMFITPAEIENCFKKAQLRTKILQGVGMRVNLNVIFDLLFRQKVHPDFKCTFSKNLSVGYCGVASKINRNNQVQGG